MFVFGGHKLHALCRDTEGRHMTTACKSVTCSCHVYTSTIHSISELWQDADRAHSCDPLHSWTCFNVNNVHV